MPSEVPSQKKKPGLLRSPGRERDMPSRGSEANCHCLVAAANYFEHGVVTVLLSKEEAGSISGVGGSVQTRDRRVAIGEVQPGRFVVALVLKSRSAGVQQVSVHGRGRITPLGEDAGVRAVEKVEGPDGIEGVQLPVKLVATIFADNQGRLI